MHTNATTRIAKDVMDDVLRAQRAGQYCEWRPCHTRHSLAGYADSQGLVQQGTVISLFDGTQGKKNVQGFNRILTPADTWLRSGDSQMPSTQEYVAFSMACTPSPEMPFWMSEAIIYYGTITQKRGPTEYVFGQVGDWPNGNYGRLAAAAATGQAVTIFQGSNGLGGSRTFAENALVALPTRQPMEFYLSLNQSFYATATGESVTAGGVVIDNTGATLGGSAPAVATFEREICGLVRFVLWGYMFSLPG